MDPMDRPFRKPLEPLRADQLRELLISAATEFVSHRAQLTKQQTQTDEKGEDDDGRGSSQA